MTRPGCCSRSAGGRKRCAGCCSRKGSRSPRSAACSARSARSLYTKLVLRALATVWRQASGGVAFTFAAQPVTLATGLVSGVLLAAVAMWLASRRQLRQNAGSLMASAGALETSAAPAKKRRSWSLGIALGSAVLAPGCWRVPAAHSPEGFFGVGSLLLIAGHRGLPLLACAARRKRPARSFRSRASAAAMPPAGAGAASPPSPCSRAASSWSWRWMPSASARAQDGQRARLRHRRLRADRRIRAADLRRPELRRRPRSLRAR